MIFKKSKKMSRLKKKLLIYFILVAIVSISVSGEIILELSSPRFRYMFIDNFFKEISVHLTDDKIMELKKNLEINKVYKPLDVFRNRMILLLLVISISIIVAFFLFAKDIVKPMDSLVNATKKITAGDLTIYVPVMSNDEIGQLAELINDMNINLQDVLFRLKQDADVNIDYIKQIFLLMSNNIDDKKSDNILKSKRMKKSDFYSILKANKDIKGKLSAMSRNLGLLVKFLDMYKTYSIPGELTQEEIESTLEHYSMD